MINISQSMQMGFYIKTRGAIHRGDIVALCLPNKYKKIGIGHNYIPKGDKCAGAAPLIKEVIAIPLDTVELKDDKIVVNGIRYFYATVTQNSKGQPLDSYPRGVYVKNGYWLIGTHAKNSWDSRYWGPLPRTYILYKLKPFLIWGK